MHKVHYFTFSKIILSLCKKTLKHIGVSKIEKYTIVVCFIGGIELLQRTLEIHSEQYQLWKKNNQKTTQQNTVFTQWAKWTMLKWTIIKFFMFFYASTIAIDYF